MSPHRFSRYVLDDVVPMSAVQQAFVSLVQCGTSPVTPLRESLIVILAGSDWGLAGVAIIPSNANGAMPHPPALHLVPDSIGSHPQLHAPAEHLLPYGLQERLDPSVSPCDRLGSRAPA
jgi:hypothetical protein